MSFSTRQDGQIEVDLGLGLRLFTHALNDCVTSRPPRGAEENGPSTFWVDVTDQSLERALLAGLDDQFSEGNSHELWLKSGQIEARSAYPVEEGEPGEVLAVADFRRVLAGWRQQIVQAPPADPPVC